MLNAVSGWLLVLVVPPELAVLVPSRPETCLPNVLRLGQPVLHARASDAVHVRRDYFADLFESGQRDNSDQLHKAGADFAADLLLRVPEGRDLPGAERSVGLLHKEHSQAQFGAALPGRRLHRRHLLPQKMRLR